MSKPDNKTTEQRRKALKKLLAGTSAAGIVASTPEKWSTPIINSVVLPSHAQTSQLPLNYTEMNVSLAPEDGLQELLIPTAHAGFGLRDGMICINFNTDMKTYSARVVFGNVQSPVEATGTGGTIGNPLPLSYDCGDENAIALTIESGPSLSGVPYLLCETRDGGNCISGTLMSGDCSVIAECLD